MLYDAHFQYPEQRRSQMWARSAMIVSFGSSIHLEGEPAVLIRLEYVPLICLALGWAIVLLSMVSWAGSRVKEAKG